MIAPVAPIRVAERDARAVRVDLGGVEPEFLHHRAGLRREGFVGLDHVEVAHLQPALASASFVAGTGPMPMMVGSTPACA